MIQVKPHIAAMTTYQPPWVNMDRSAYLRLDMNENTLEPPAHVLAALQQEREQQKIQLYPDYGSFMPLLARYVGLTPEHLMVTNGSDQAIEIILRAFLAQGDEMLMAQPGFPMFAQIAGVIGAKIIGVPYQQEVTSQPSALIPGTSWQRGRLSFPTSAFWEAITPQTKLIVFINPDNPTGVAVDLTMVEEVLKAYPELPVLVDEAYFEFTGNSALALLKRYPNVMITRTFSKAFAMAGLRLGYVVAHPELIAQFHKIRGPFDVNRSALIAAQAQLESPEAWQAFIQEVMQRAKPYVQTFLEAQEVCYFPGAANFLLIQPPERNQAVQFLKHHGILVRPMSAPLIQTTFRLSLGTLAQMQRFAEVYQAYLQSFKN